MGQQVEIVREGMDPFHRAVPVLQIRGFALFGGDGYYFQAAASGGRLRKPGGKNSYHIAAKQHYSFWFIKSLQPAVIANDLVHGHHFK